MKKEETKETAKEKAKEENKNVMEEKSIYKLSMKMSVPMIISMMSLALYNLVDSMFVSNIGNEALTAISLSYPFQAIVTGIGLGTGMGVNSLASRFLGKKEKSNASNTLNHGVILTFISYLIVAIIALFFSKQLIMFFTDDLITIDYANTYLTICLTFSFGLLFQILFEKINEAYGLTTNSMLIQFSGAVINLILDPILIYGYLGVPALGIKGAAIATVTGQILGMLLGVVLIKKNNIPVNLKEFKFDFSIIGKIYEVAFPMMISESLAAFVTLYLNKELVSYSEYAVPFWGIYLKVQTFIFMVAYGFNYGMIPIVAYDYGAKNFKRLKDIVKLYLLYSFGVMIIGMLLFTFGSKLIFLAYNAKQEIVEFGISAFRIICIGFLFAAASLVLSSVFTAIGKGTYNLIVYLLRQIIVTVPLIYFLKGVATINNIWYVFVLAEFVAMIVSIILYFVSRRKFKEAN